VRRASVVLASDLPVVGRTMRQRTDVTMSATSVHAIVALSILSTIGHGNELKDYCSIYKFHHPPGGLSFTKEVVTTEYANVGAFKALHCCLRGYRSIEW